MCKLCNTDRPPMTEKNYNDPRTSNIAKKFCKAVIDYIEEFPCTNCKNNYTTAYLIHNTSIDTYIINVLFHNYLAAPNRKEWNFKNNKLRKKVFNLSKENKKKHKNKMKKNTERRSIGNGITKVHYLPTGRVTYTFVRTINKKAKGYSFDMLEEAIQMKEYLSKQKGKQNEKYTN